MLAVIELNDSASSPSWSSRLHGDLVREVALPDALGAGEQLVHRSGDRLRQGETGHERDRTR